MIPDIKLHEIVKSCLLAVRSDHEVNGGTPSDTILWHLLNSTKMADTGKYAWYEQAVEIFVNRTESHPKHLETRLFFDRERAAIPTIHIMMSGESKGADGIGLDVGYRPEQVIGDQQRPVYNRQFDINANIIVTSDNTFETVIIYHVLKSMIISLMTHIQLVGFINPNISGRDITLSQEIVPNGLYARTINFTAGYELDVPEACLNKIVQEVWIQMKNINDQPISPYIGAAPITPTSGGTDEVTPIDEP
jgi:hypothetical protein